MNHKWNNRSIAHPDDHGKLEAEAAAQELGPTKLPRQQAEEVAYSSYKNRQHTEGAAHHLRGLRLAVSTGDKDEAKRHNTLYVLHLNALGHSASQPPPGEIEDLAKKPMTEKMHAAANHRADGILMSGPLSKAAREYVGGWPLSKADGDGTGDKGPDANQSTTPTTPNPTAASTTKQAMRMPDVSSPDKEPQRFDKGSIVVYANTKGENYVPNTWIGTVTNKHLLKIHSTSSPGRKNYYEIQWRTPEGKIVDDFLAQDELAPYGKRHSNG